LGEIAVVLFHV